MSTAGVPRAADRHPARPRPVRERASMERQTTPQRRSVEPEATNRERRPPQQLYVPPGHRLGGARSGFNRASSPGFSTCSEIVTSWRVRDTPPVRSSSPGPLSPVKSRPPTGPRRRPSQPGAEPGQNWRQSSDSIGPGSRPSSRQGEPGQGSRPSSRQGESGQGSPSKRPGRRRRRGGRSRSHEHPAEEIPVTPPHAPWRREHRDSWDGGQPGRSPSPAPRNSTARPRFQQPYQPPGARNRETSDPAANLPPDTVTSPYHDNRARLNGRNSAEGRRQYPQQNAHPQQQQGNHQWQYQQHQRQQPNRPLLDQPMSQSMHGADRPEIGDDPTKSASLPRSRRRRSSSARRRRRRGQGAAASPQPEQQREGSLPRSPSPTALLASFQASSPRRRPPPEPASPQSPTDIIASLRARDSGAATPVRPQTPQLVTATAAGAPEPPSPTVLLQQLMLSPPATAASLAHLVNTTDDEKASLSLQRGRGRGRRLAGLHGSDGDSPRRSPLRRPGPANRNLATEWQQSGPSLAVTEGTAATSSPDPAAPVGSGNEGESQTTPRSHAGLHISIPNATVCDHPESDEYKLSGSVLRTLGPVNMHEQDLGKGEENQLYTANEDTSDPHVFETMGVSTTTDMQQDPFDTPSGPQAQLGKESPCPAEAAVSAAVAVGSPSEEAPTPDGGPARRHSSASSGRDFFSMKLEEPFDWADEVEEWEQRCNERAPSPTEPASKSSVTSADKAAPVGGDSPAGRAAPPSGLPEHVIEVYSFPSSFSQQDLMIVFQDFAERGLRLTRVDDSHALAVFENAIAAREALRLQHPLVLSRPLSEASARTRQRAAAGGAPMQPAPRARPATSALLAGRLVASALGLPAQQPPLRRDQERRKLRDAKDQKRKAAKQRQDAWDGRF